MYFFAIDDKAAMKERKMDASQALSSSSSPLEKHFKTVFVYSVPLERSVVDPMTYFCS